MCTYVPCFFALGAGLSFMFSLVFVEEGYDHGDAACEQGDT